MGSSKATAVAFTFFSRREDPAAAPTIRRGAAMSLAAARAQTAPPLPPLSGEGPYPGAALKSWVDRPFWLPPQDPRLEPLFHGEPAPSPPLDNLVGAHFAWQDHPEYMAYLDPASPNHHAKLVERALYLRRWAPFLPRRPLRALDVGAGIGRFSTWLLEQGHDVVMVDPDLRSLWRAVWSAASLPGRIDAWWSTAESMPPLGTFDVVFAPEMLCYAEDPERALGKVAEALAPGGLLFASVEARWGWVFCQDTPPATVDAWLDDGVVHVPGDRWVRTFERADFESLLLRYFDIEEMIPSHYGYSGAFEAAAGPLDEAAALRLEDRMRAHPRGRELNRAWLAAARRRA